MTDYRRKPTTVAAEKFEIGNYGDVVSLLISSKSAFHLERGYEVGDEGPKAGTEYVSLNVWTVDNNGVNVPDGAYVVIDSAGYAYPCDARIFEANHDRAAQSA